MTGVHQLLFSTRAADPRSGSDYNREIIAQSPGAPEAARQAMARLADMTGPALGVAELPPVWACRRLDAASWLVLRAVSLGSYRKGYHQLLVHGVVLEREHLRALEGNPFLLDPALGAGAGFPFRTAHPGSAKELPLLFLPDGLGEAAGRLNRERRAALARRLAPHDNGLAHALASLRDASTTTALPASLGPGRELVEWLLLHLHPEDRARVSFHTYWAYESDVPFDVIGLPEEGADPTRRRMSRRLTLWSEEASAFRSSEEGHWRVELRRVRPEDFDRVLADYRLTVVPVEKGAPPEYEVGLDGRLLPTLEPGDSAVCLRHELGHSLDPHQEQILRRCYARGRNLFHLYRRELGALWDGLPGTASFRDWVRYLRAIEHDPPNLAREDVERQAAEALAQTADRREAWAVLAALWAVCRGREWDASFAVRLWEATLDGRGFDAWSDFFPDPVRNAVAEILAFYVEAQAASEARENRPPGWASYLRWTEEAGLSAAAAAAGIEKALAGVSDGAVEGGAEAAGLLRAYRELQKVCFELGLEDFALRVLFDREIPRLEGEPLRIRLGDGVRRLLAREAGSEGGDALASPALAEVGTARVVFGVLGERLGPAAEGWERCRDFLTAQRRPLSRACRAAAGPFLARLAFSPRAALFRAGFDLLIRLGRAGEEVDSFLDVGRRPPSPGRAGGQPDRGARTELLTEAARAAAAVLEGVKSAETSAGPTPSDSASWGPVAGLLAFLVARPAGEEGLPEAEALELALLDLLDRGLLATWEGPGGDRPTPERLDLRERTAEYVTELLDGAYFNFEGWRLHRWRHLLLDELLDEAWGERLPESPSPARPAAEVLYRACVTLAWKVWAESPRSPGARFAVLRLLAWDPAPPATAEPRHKEWLRRAVPGPLWPEARLLFETAFPDRRAA